jgi:hypothetical protein
VIHRTVVRRGPPISGGAPRYERSHDVRSGLYAVPCYAAPVAGGPDARRLLASASLALGLSLAASPAAIAGEDDVLVELHFQPVANAQIAIWLTREDGTFVQDVFVTQATGSLGIGNRPGRWDFLSSWRFPYGPRPQVLPVWAHARGRAYPELIFHDDDTQDLDSLGWHENTSSPEPYFCRPLAADEHDTISTDTMTCPSPATFQSDKGRFEPSGATSPYPPRNDLTSYEDGHDHPDVYMLSALNDLDAFTGATPAGFTPALLTAIVDGEIAKAGPLVAWIEVNLEHDENADWEFDREADHYVDPRLENFGIEYFGQPSVVYRVPFEPELSEFAGTEAWAGYGDFDGATGTVNPPDDSISTTAGSGADRLQVYSLNGETFRFGVFSHGLGSGAGLGGGNPPGWGSCQIHALPAMTEVELEAIDFDTVRVHFTLPTLEDDVDVRNVRVYYRAGEMPISVDNASSAIQAVPAPEDCGGDMAPGGTAYCDLRELFGNHTYQIGIRYEDACSNASGIVADEVTTPAQEFAQVDGFCFVATAAYGANWEGRVQALRAFRDAFLKPNALGMSFVALYYGYGPQMASVLDRVPYARVLARQGLQPLADAARLLTLAAR